MSIRKTLLSVALLGAFAVPAFASGSAGYVSERGEATYSGPMPGSASYQISNATSRADVVREMANARQNGTLSYVGDYPASLAVAKGGSPASSSALSRETVRQEFQSLQRNPVTADGYRFVSGEIGYVFVGRGAASQASTHAAAR